MSDSLVFAMNVPAKLLYLQPAEPFTISSLISALQRIQAEHGDLPVHVGYEGRTSPAIAVGVSDYHVNKTIAPVQISEIDCAD